MKDNELYDKLIEIGFEWAPTIFEFDGKSVKQMLKNNVIMELNSNTIRVTTNSLTDVDVILNGESIFTKNRIFLYQDYTEVFNVVKNTIRKIKIGNILDKQ